MTSVHIERHKLQISWHVIGNGNCDLFPVGREPEKVDRALHSSVEEKDYTRSDSRARSGSPPVQAPRGLSAGSKLLPTTGVGRLAEST